MASIGLNVDALGTYSPDLVRSLGATWIRIVALPDVDLREYFEACRSAGVRVLLVLARESGGDYAGYARRYTGLVDSVQVGNEPDLESPSSWTMSQRELTALGRSVRSVFPTTPLVCAGLASGQPGWLDGMDLSWCDALAFHPYLKDAPNPDDVEDLQDVPALLEGYQAYGKPLLITEWGWWGTDERRGAEEVSDMLAWADRSSDLEVFFYFCISDAMVAPFGLLGPRGREKPAARAFKTWAPLAVHSLWPEAVAAPVEPPAALPLGVDVASYQGRPDWAAVARSGIAFAITKLTEGVNYVNPTFGHNWTGIKAAGLVRGVYHFARPSVNTPDAEAVYFLEQLRYWGGDLAPGDLVALDIEDERAHNGGAYGSIANWSLGWLQYVEAVIGFRPIVYTGPWYVSRPGWGPAPPELGAYGLWLAAYQSEMPRAPQPWRAVAFWQFTSNGRIDGIVGDVDVNRFNGTADRIALYGKPGAVEEPEPDDGWNVGAGIRAEMRRRSDRPASHEHYLTPDWSEAFGVSGRRYVYLPAVGRVVVYDPAA